ncbi:desulfoferrodoxin family protein [Maridesulfovibrio hydrothermalis]|uniref:Desulfoferrodoxin ferrous iron-binding domain-containing protein n=1 Tax=Maridesulfovibrio hydrothermalis AM13 = DSM 14728 TaxID=1121451 RepID=L0RBH7_9BACT|nr:desulfoferrodoxin family protein [Maridesulfovibrio hydrothermalis]CCO24114.1 conserved exported protein of unknown function [Maridesulfovibrio hydrothermalis AM13 = DSM 14728]
MNSRRKFMAMSAAAAAATFMPIASASASKGESSKYPQNVIFTQKYPGVWEGKAASHLPQVEVKNDTVTIRTMHPMTEKHYIVRHTLIDEDGNVIGAKTFSNTDKKAVSRFKIPAGNDEDKFYATSFCNKHDFWVAKVKL